MLRLSRKLMHAIIVLLFASWLPLHAQADEIWTVIAKDSYFGHGVNKLVIKRRGMALADPGEIANLEAKGRYLVISGASIYLAVSEQTPTPAGSFVTTDATRWPNMKLIRVGEHIFRDYCFRCFRYRDGLREDQITFKFSKTAVDLRAAMTETVVLNTR